MTHSWTSTFALAMLITAGAAQAQVNVILDTDFRADCDDAGALGILHALADNGECRIRGVAISDKDPWSPRGVDAVNTWYRRPNIPIGIYQGDLLPESFSYGGLLANEFRNDEGPVTENATTMYRRVLSQLPDQSTKIVTTGFLTNLYELLQSPADIYSPLDGGALVAAKCSEVIMLAGRFPSYGTEFNTHHNGLWNESAWVANELDVLGIPAIFCGIEIGQNVRTGSVIRQHPTIHPVGRAYDDWLTFFELATGQPQPDRPAWDHCAVLYAVRGLGSLWTLVDVGRNNITAGGNAWQTSPDSTHAYIKYINTSSGQAQLQVTMDQLQQQWPQHLTLPYTAISTFEDGTSGTLKRRAVNGVPNVSFGHLQLAGTQEHIFTGKRPNDQTIIARMEIDNTQDYANVGFTMHSPSHDGGWSAGPRVSITHWGGADSLRLRLYDGTPTNYGPVTPDILIPGAVPGVPFTLRIDTRGDQVTAWVNGQEILPPTTLLATPANLLNYTLLRSAIPDAGARVDWVMIRAFADGPGVVADSDGTIWFSEVEPGPLDPPAPQLSGVLYGNQFLDAVAWKNLLYSLGPNFVFEGLELGNYELYGLRDVPWLFDTPMMQLHNGIVDSVLVRDLLD